jgi:putative transposase
VKTPRAKRQKKPKHATQTRAYVFALDVDEKQSASLHALRTACWEVRNKLTEERRTNRALVREAKAGQVSTATQAGPPVTYLTRAEQYKSVAALAASEQFNAQIHSLVLQNIAVRVDEGTKRWLEAMAEGRHHVRPPGPIALKRYKSFTYPQYGNGVKIHKGKLHLSKLGAFKLFGHRKIRGLKKAVTVKWRDGRWWAIITAELQAVDLYEPRNSWAKKPEMGSDPGLKFALTLSDGRRFLPPEPLKASLQKLKRKQRAMARKFEARKLIHAQEQALAKANSEGRSEKFEPIRLREVPYSNRLKAQIRAVAKCHTKVARQRQYFNAKLASQISDTVGRLAREKHPLQFMLANRRLARKTADTALGAQKHALLSKLGPDRFVEVANYRPGIGGNSQTCLCGEPVPKTLKDRDHRCPACGIQCDRDLMSASIVEHQAFGTLHRSFVMDCGQQVIASALESLECRVALNSQGLEPESVQALKAKAAVRRGESKRRAGKPKLPRTRKRSPEFSVKRQPPATLKQRNTADGKPTAEGKTARTSSICTQRCPADPKTSEGNTLKEAPAFRHGEDVTKEFKAMRRSLIAFLFVIFCAIGFFAVLAPDASAQTFTPGSDLSNAALTGPSTVANEANLKQALGYIEMWRMIAWLLMLLAGVIGAILWTLGHRQMVLGVIGAAVILGGLFNFIAAFQAQSAVGASSQNFKVSSSSIANSAVYHPSNQALLGQTAQAFADDGIRVLTTVIPLCMMAFGCAAVAGSVLQEGLLMRLFPGFVVGSVLMFADQTLATFFTSGTFPAALPNNTQLIQISVPTDSDISTYSGSVAPEPTANASSVSPAAFSLSSGTSASSTLPSQSSFNLGSGVASGPKGGVASLGNNVISNSAIANIDSDGDPSAQSWDATWQAQTSGGYNAGTTPFVVASPQQMSQLGVQMGDWSTITNNATGQMTWARVGDSGNPNEYGEISEAAATAVGISYTAHGTVGNPSVTVHIYPGTKNIPNMGA